VQTCLFISLLRGGRPLSRASAEAYLTDCPMRDPGGGSSVGVARHHQGGQVHYEDVLLLRGIKWQRFVFSSLAYWRPVPQSRSLPEKKSFVFVSYYM